MSDKEDAKRWRWFCNHAWIWRSNHCLQQFWPPFHEIASLEEGGPGSGELKKRSIDAAIDKAMKEGK